MENKDLLEYAKELINNYNMKEFDYESDFSDLTNISLAYTELEDYDEDDNIIEYNVPIQVSVNLIDYVLTVKLGEYVVDEIKYDTLSDLIKNELEWLNFDSLTSTEDYMWEIYHEKLNEWKQQKEKKIKIHVEYCDDCTIRVYSNEENIDVDFFDYGRYEKGSSDDEDEYFKKHEDMINSGELKLMSID